MYYWTSALRLFIIVLRGSLPHLHDFNALPIAMRREVTDKIRTNILTSILLCWPKGRDTMYLAEDILFDVLNCGIQNSLCFSSWFIQLVWGFKQKPILVSSPIVMRKQILGRILAKKGMCYNRANTVMKLTTLWSSVYLLLANTAAIALKFRRLLLYCVMNQSMHVWEIRRRWTLNCGVGRECNACFTFAVKFCIF